MWPTWANALRKKQQTGREEGEKGEKKRDIIEWKGDKEGSPG